MKLVETENSKLRLEDKCGFCGSDDVQAVNMASDAHVCCRRCKTRTPRCENIRDAVQLWNWWFVYAGTTRFERLAALREHEAGLKRQADVLLAMRPK